MPPVISEARRRSSSASVSSAESQAPSRVTPIGTGSQIVRSSAAMTFRAEVTLTSCSPDLPPKMTATRVVSVIANPLRMPLPVRERRRTVPSHAARLRSPARRHRPQQRRPLFTKKLQCNSLIGCVAAGHAAQADVLDELPGWPLGGFLNIEPALRPRGCAVRRLASWLAAVASSSVESPSLSRTSAPRTTLSLNWPRVNTLPR